MKPISPSHYIRLMVELTELKQQYEIMMVDYEEKIYLLQKEIEQLKKKDR